MQSKTNEVEVWAPAWWSYRRDDLRRSDKTISTIGGQPRCNLCGESLPWGSLPREEHHQLHMRELDVWIAGLPPEETDSGRRVHRRRIQRERELSLAEDLGEDSFLYAVEGREPRTKHWIRRRRVRHPREETEARIRELHAEGMMRSVIAERMKISEDYVRRVLKRIENGDGSTEKGPSKPLAMRQLSDLAVQGRGLPTGDVDDAEIGGDS